jgi:acid phosphatase
MKHTIKKYAFGSQTRFFFFRWPPFGTAILFELFKKKDKEEHFVRVKYNENTLKLPGCAKKGNHKDGDESLCTLEAFQQIVKDQVPQDWAKECKA